MTHATKNIVWLNGEWVDQSQAVVPIDTHGLHYGTGFFEGLRSHRQSSGGVRVFRIEQHIQRFAESAERLHMNLPYPVADFRTACEEILERNGLEEAYIRPIAFSSSPYHVWAKATGALHVAVLAVPFPGHVSDSEVPTRRAIVSQFRRSNSNRDLHRAKAVGHYTTVAVAAREAVAKGCEQAIFVQEDEAVCEALTDNLFVVRAGQVSTPSPDHPILLGITRRFALEALHELDVPTAERSIPLQELFSADEIFTTSTAGGIQALTAVNGTVIGNGQPGPIVRAVRDAYIRSTRG